MAGTTFQVEVGRHVNQQLKEVFQLIHYQHPFWLRIAMHLEERVNERLTDPADKKRFANLMNRITTVGICELLYYHTRHKLGEEITGIEFFNGDVIVPFNFRDDTVVMNTVFVRRPDQDRSAYRRIDLSDARLAQW